MQDLWLACSNQNLGIGHRPPPLVVSCPPLLFVGYLKRRLQGGTRELDMGEIGGGGGEGADWAAVDSTGQGAYQEHKVRYGHY